jgi:hypothetical protein
MTLLVGVPESSGGRIRSFNCRYHSTINSTHSYICSGGWTIGPLVTAVQRRSLTPSTWWWSSSTAAAAFEIRYKVCFEVSNCVRSMWTNVKFRLTVFNVDSHYRNLNSCSSFGDGMWTDADSFLRVSFIHFVQEHTETETCYHADRSSMYVKML